MMKTLLLAFAAATLGGPVAAADSPNRVVMVVDRIDEVRNLPAALAESLGYFKDEGLVVTLVEGRDEVPTDMMLADGRADASMAFYHHTFMSQADGRTTEAVAVLGISPALTLMVADRLKDQIRTPADLKGRKVFTGGANSGKTTTANWLMLHAGGRIEDFVHLPLQPRDKMAAALRDGEADAIVAHEPDASYYKAGGIATAIADITTPQGTRASLGTLFPTTSVIMANSYVEAHPETVRHLVNALIRTLKFINGHKPDEILAALPKGMGGKDAKTFQEDLVRDLPMFATDGLLPVEAGRKELEVMAAFQQKYAGTRFDETYTNRFVDSALMH